MLEEVLLELAVEEVVVTPSELVLELEVCVFCVFCVLCVFWLLFPLWFVVGVGVVVAELVEATWLGLVLGLGVFAFALDEDDGTPQFGGLVDVLKVVYWVPTTSVKVGATVGIALLLFLTALLLACPTGPEPGTGGVTV